MGFTLNFNRELKTKQKKIYSADQCGRCGKFGFKIIPHPPVKYGLYAPIFSQ
jgi:hypothetical protein